MSHERLKTLREERAKIGTQMRAILDKAEGEKRDLTKEENEQHNKLFDETEKLREKITREERQIDLERDLARIQTEEEHRKPQDKGNGDDAEKRQMAAFRKYLVSGYRGLTEEEARALQSDSDVEGGYLNAPQVFVKELLKDMDNAVFIRQLATKFQLGQAVSMGVPTLDADMDDADWTTELATGAEDTAMRLGKRELAPNPLAKRVKISKKLLRTSVLPIEGIVRERLTYKFGVTQEKAYLLGNGNKQPLGLFVASNDGIPTTRDVSTGNSTTAIAFDGLIEAKYSVKPAYWPKAQWLFHREAVKGISKLKNAGTGEYAWRESVRAGEPDTLLGKPLNISEYVPNTFTTGLYVGMFGDFSNYWIADALDMQIQRLVELYAESNQDGFIGRLESDGMPARSEAFARVKLA